MADAQPANGLTEQMSQLDAARNLVLGDAAFYPQIVQGILPIIGANARLELRRWGADFLAETFASPALPTQQKGKLSLQVLQTLKDLLELPNEDTTVVRSVVQAAASLYPLVFRHMYVMLLISSPLSPVYIPFELLNSVISPDSIPVGDWIERFKLYKK